MAAIPSLGLGSGLTVTTGGMNIVLDYPAGGFRVKNVSGGDLYVVLNAIIVDINGAPIAAVFPAGKTPSPDLQMSRMTAAAIVARGLKLLNSESVDFRGLAAFNGGPQIFCVALVAVTNSVVVTGGQTDVSN